MGDIKIILFKMNGCGHCVNFLPKWNKLKEDTDFASKNNITYEEYEAESPETEKYQISGFPTVLFIKDSKKEEISPGNPDELKAQILEFKKEKSGGADYKKKYLKYKSKYLSLKNI